MSGARRTLRKHRRKRHIWHHSCGTGATTIWRRKQNDGMWYQSGCSACGHGGDARVGQAPWAHGTRTRLRSAVAVYLMSPRFDVENAEDGSLKRTVVQYREMHPDVGLSRERRDEEYVEGRSDLSEPRQPQTSRMRWSAIME